MTLKEIGDEFKANAETVRLWVTRGDLSAVRAGRKWIVRRSEVLRFLDLSSAFEQAVAQPPTADVAPARRGQDTLGRDQRPPAPGSRLTAGAPTVGTRSDD